MFLTAMKPGRDLQVRDCNDCPVVPQVTARTLQDFPARSVWFTSDDHPDLCLSLPPTPWLRDEDVDIQEVQCHQLYCLPFHTALQRPRNLPDPHVATLTSSVLFGLVLQTNILISINVTRK